jgi:putative transposase
VHRQGAAGDTGADGEEEATGRTPTGRGTSGTKRHTLTGGHGAPIAVILTGATRTDMKEVAEVLDAVVLERPGRPGEPGAAPDPPAPAQPSEEHLCLDRGVDHEECRMAARARGYEPHIPARGRPDQPLPAPGDPARHPPRRWVVEVAPAWFNRFRRLLSRWETHAAHYLGSVQVAAWLIIYRKLRHVRSLSG